MRERSFRSLEVPVHQAVPLAGNRFAVAMLVAALLTTHVALVAWLGAHQSPNVDEPAHLAAGMALWQYASFDLYCVNPPLMRAVATLPILLMPHEELWGDFEGAPRPRPEFVLGAQFVESHPDQWERFLVAARWALLPFTALGGLFCYLWAAELFGRKSGLLALALWCFSPNILTWSAVIGTDGVAAAMGIGAGYFFWRWLRSPTHLRAAVAGLFLGLALLSKTTWLVLFAVWPAVWLVWRTAGSRRGAQKPPAFGLAFVLLFGLNVLNLGYGFDGSFTPLREFEFRSHLLRGADSQESSSAIGNRFAHSALRVVPIPLPEPFVRGIDLQKVDFEKGKPSYLFGEWSDRGWWYYYLVGLGIKVPLGTWCLGLLAVVGLLPAARVAGGDASAAKPAGILDQTALLMPALAVLLLASSQDGFSGHFRYLLPAFPFAFVWVSQAATWIGYDRLASSALVLGASAWSIVSGLGVYPHTVSYFNEVAGGPAGGHHYLLGSSVSWSQDRFYLRAWIRAHSEVDSPYMALERSVSLERLGLRSRGEPPRGKPKKKEQHAEDDITYGPVPGWHVLDIQRIHGPDGRYLYFLDFEPAARIGPSLSVYHITLEDANRIRRKQGLREISDRPSIIGRFVDEASASQTAERSISVALFVPEGQASDEDVRAAITSAKGLALITVTEDDVRNGSLSESNVLVIPGGNATIQGAALGADGQAAVREFVRNGGGYVGICAGAYLATVNHPSGLKLVNAQVATGLRFVPGYGDVSASFRGWGSASIELSPNGRRLFKGSPECFRLDYTGGPILFRANAPDLPDYEVLADFRSELWKHPFQRGTMTGTPAIVATLYGQGRVMLFSPHPESVAEGECMLVGAIKACAK